MFKRFSDAEFEQAILRLLLGIIVQIYFLTYAPFQLYFIPVFAAFILISLAIALHIYLKPGEYFCRRITGQIIDLGSISILLYFCGEVAITVFGVYLWVILGNGFRFGISYLLSSIMIATLFFSIVALREPFLLEHKTLTLGIGITLMIVPVYFAVLLHRLNLTKKRLERLSHFDELTGLTNRRVFDSQIASEFSRLKRLSAPFSLVLVDIDHFKRVNDTHGHLAGDAVLQNIAQVLRQICRDIDIVSRFGGEEFALLLPGHERDKKTPLGERFRQAVEMSITSVDDIAIRVTISVGVAYWSDQYDSTSDWIQDADAALYLAKQQGRNRVVIA